MNFRQGDLVRWTFAKTSTLINPTNDSKLAILLERETLPRGSWIILLQDGAVFHADESELELVRACR